MCGRFALFAPASQVIEVFGTLDLDDPLAWRPRYNIAPTTPNWIVTDEGGVRRLSIARWGLQPAFLASRGGPPLFNARAETLAEKPIFRAAFARRRALVPASGFFEWLKVGKARHARWFSPRDGELFAFGAIWAVTRDDSDVEQRSFSVITTAPNAVTAPIHDRMPLILAPDRWDAWLRPRAGDTADWSREMGPCDPDRVRVDEVGSVVNDVRNDVPECVVPQARLFG